MSEEKKLKLKRMSVLITVDQYEFLRKQSFLHRKSMTSIFREMVDLYFADKFLGKKNVEKHIEAEQN